MLMPARGRDRDGDDVAPTVAEFCSPPDLCARLGRRKLLDHAASAARGSGLSFVRSRSLALRESGRSIELGSIVVGRSPGAEKLEALDSRYRETHRAKRRGRSIIVQKQPSTLEVVASRIVFDVKEV